MHEQPRRAARRGSARRGALKAAVLHGNVGLDLLLEALLGHKRRIAAHTKAHRVISARRSARGKRGAASHRNMHTHVGMVVHEGGREGGRERAYPSSPQLALDVRLS